MIFHSDVIKSVPESKSHKIPLNHIHPPFYNGFPMVFLWFEDISSTTDDPPSGKASVASDTSEALRTALCAMKRGSRLSVRHRNAMLVGKNKTKSVF